MASFDWVSPLSRCSLDRVFLILSEVVSGDVRTVNGLKRDGVSFAFSTQAQDRIIVTRERDLIGVKEIVSVFFQLLPNGISTKRVTGKSGEPILLFVVRPSLHMDDEGGCLLEIDQQTGYPQPLRFWEVSKKALVDLFFAF